MVNTCIKDMTLKQLQKELTIVNNILEKCSNSFMGASHKQEVLLKKEDIESEIQLRELGL